MVLAIVPPSQVLRSEVGCELAFGVQDHVALAVQVAVASTAGTSQVEDLVVELDGRTVEVSELEVEHGGRVHLLRAGAGRLSVRYHAVVVHSPPATTPISETEMLVALRQSRYCPSDTLDAFAHAELAWLAEGADRGRAIGTWVAQRLHYDLGSSGPLDTAVDTLMAGRGVCRDFAHLTVALCRAIGVPARFASAYAPGLWPMDFHAVAEVATGDQWEIVDSTRLAPRQSLLRIATGRDAADTAFATTLAGSADLLTSTVTAFVDGDLPRDDHTTAIALA